MIVSSRQMESFCIICNAEAEDIIATTKEVQKFKKGQMVRVIDGNFKGVRRSDTLSRAAKSRNCH